MSPVIAGVRPIAILACFALLVCSRALQTRAQSITDVSQVQIGEFTKAELDRLVKSVVVEEFGTILPQESLLVGISRTGARSARRCHTLQGQGAVLRELNLRSDRQEKWRQQVELQIRIISLFKNGVTSRLAAEVAQQDAVLSRLIQERVALTAEGRNYDDVARKMEETRANKTAISQPLLDLVDACDGVTDNRNRLLEFIAGDIAVLNVRRKLQETVVHRSVMSRICVGAEHACVIGPDSGIACWGRCTEGQCTPPEEPLVLYRQISCSDYSTCAADNDDIVRCWGSDLFGIATPPAIPLSLISMGSGHACGIARNNSRVLCWGWNDLGQTDVPFNLTATAVASSRYHSCALDINFGVVCWGANRNNAAQPPSFLAAEGRFSGTFSAIAANLSDVATSLYHSCALGAPVNFLSCWGAEGMSDGRAAVPTGLIPISVSTGLQHTCATNFNNAVQCFGDESAFGVAPTARFAGTAAAANITCGIPLDVPEVVCWNAAVVPLRHSRLWGGVQSVRFTNTSDLGANSSLARQSYVVQRLLQVPAGVVACTVKDTQDIGDK